MSPCGRPLDDVLEADLDVLAGEGTSGLAMHLKDCDRCRAAADAILSATARLDTVLASPGAPLDVDAILARAEVEVAPQASGASARRLRAMHWLPLAAGAVAGLIVIGDREPAPTGPMRASADEVVPLVEASPDQAVAVIPTRNPDITILWFFQGG